MKTRKMITKHEVKARYKVAEKIIERFKHHDLNNVTALIIHEIYLALEAEAKRAKVLVSALEYYADAYDSDIAYRALKHYKESE